MTTFDHEETLTAKQSNRMLLRRDGPRASGPTAGRSPPPLSLIWKRRQSLLRVEKRNYSSYTEDSCSTSRQQIGCCRARFADSRCRDQVVRVARIKTRLSLILSKMSRRESWRVLLLRRRVGYVAPERPHRFPIRLQIEATSKCNLRCPSCSHAKEKGVGQHLTEENLRQILDRLPWSPPRVVLCGIGEPLMNPQFFSLVDILAERRIRCEFSHQRTLLTPRRQQAILSRCNIDVINISCDGAGKKRLRVFGSEQTLTSGSSRSKSFCFKPSSSVAGH